MRDTGVGIPAEMLPRIFDLFAQADQSIDRAQGGLGIGLTLVRRLVEMQGGTVQARSDGPGRGSEFIIRLPASQESALSERSEPARAHEQSTATTRRVLVVDDNQDNANSVAMVLRLSGHEVATAHDGVAALEIARSWRPDVVLLDIGLPRLDGLEVARRLRQEVGLTDALIVAMTGYGQEEDRLRSLDAGFDAHLVKPIDLNALRALINKPRPR